MAKFEDLGYFLEYMVNGKFVGTTSLDKPDRKEIGYYGAKTQVADSKIILERGKTIKKGVKYVTRLYPLCGKVLEF